MRKIIILLILIVVTLKLDAREVFDFNSDWRFTANFQPSSDSELITLPHVWGTSGSDIKDINRGSCCYLKEFELPENFRGKELYLRFGGVGSVATIFVNGKYAYEHKGAFTAFNVDITSFVRYGGLNSILVVVSNSSRMDVLPFLNKNYIFGGIYAPVELMVLDKNHFSLSHYGSKGIYLKTTSVSDLSAYVDATVLVTGEPSQMLTVTLDLLDGDKKIVTSSRNLKLDSKGDGKLVLPLKIENPSLWQGKSNPYLYSVRGMITLQNRVVDSLQMSFGVRTVTINENNEFVLNGVPMRLKGVNVFQDNKSSGSAYTQRDFVKDISYITEMGVDAVRSHGGAQSDYAYQLYDREGIVAWVDLPLSSDEIYGGKGYAESYYLKENGRVQLQEMIYQLYNHPSICFWGIFDDISSTGDSPVEYIKELNNMALKISPDRITVGSSIEDGDLNSITEAISWPVSFGWKKGEIDDLEIWVKQIKTEFKNLKSSISEYGIIGDLKNYSYPSDGELKILSYSDRNKNYPQSSQALFHEKYYRVIDANPIFWGTFINSMFDYLSHDNNAQLGGFSNVGLVSYDRSYKKDAFYFYKANWNKEDDFVHIANKDSYRRVGKSHKIKVYSNQSNVKLLVNGKLVSENPTDLGVVTWDNVQLRQGSNRIMVVSGGASDVLNIEVYDDLLAQ